MECQAKSMDPSNTDLLWDLAVVFKTGQVWNELLSPDELSVLEKEILSNKSQFVSWVGNCKVPVPTREKGNAAKLANLVWKIRRILTIQIISMSALQLGTQQDQLKAFYTQNLTAHQPQNIINNNNNNNNTTSVNEYHNTSNTADNYLPYHRAVTSLLPPYIRIESIHAEWESSEYNFPFTGATIKEQSEPDHEIQIKKQKTEAFSPSAVPEQTAVSPRSASQQTSFQLDESEDNNTEVDSRGKKKRANTKGGQMSPPQVPSRSMSPETTPRQQRGQTPEERQSIQKQLEAVLTGLKNYSEHSYPFLQKVKKSDAPDYYEVIKNPMDLALMTKKLNRGEYTTKAQFQTDLNLMIKNCRTYNTDPSSRIYVTHANEMEKKGKQLLGIPKNAPLTTNIDAQYSPPASPSALAELGSVPQTPLSPAISATSPSTLPEFSNFSPTAALPSPQVLKTGQQKRIGRPPKKKGLTSPSQTPMTSPRPMRQTKLIESFEIQPSPPPQKVFLDSREQEIVAANQLISTEGILKFFGLRQKQNYLNFCDRDAVFRDPIEIEAFHITSKFTKIADTFGETQVSFLPEITHFFNSSPNVFFSAIPAPPPPPQIPSQLTTHPFATHKRLSFEPPITSEFPAQNSDQLPIELLRKSIGTILAHVGFEGVDGYAFDVLVDVSVDYMTQLTRRFQNNLQAPIKFSEDLINATLMGSVGSTSSHKLREYIQNSTSNHPPAHSQELESRLLRELYSSPYAVPLLASDQPNETMMMKRDVGVSSSAPAQASTSITLKVNPANRRPFPPQMPQKTGQNLVPTGMQVQIPMHQQIPPQIHQQMQQMQQQQQQQIPQVLQMQQGPHHPQISQPPVQQQQQQQHQQPQQQHQPLHQQKNQKKKKKA